MGDTEAMTTDEKSEIEERVAVALDENYDKHDLVARAHSGDITEDSEDEAMEEDDAEMVDAEEVDTEVSNLEQAWQMFDLSKVIYAKSGETAKECEALILLAEVSMENSNFNQAVEDLTECLAKRIKTLPSDSRMIAETHYQLGVAQAHCAQQCADQSQQLLPVRQRREEPYLCGRRSDQYHGKPEEDGELGRHLQGREGLCVHLQRHRSERDRHKESCLLHVVFFT